MAKLSSLEYSGHKNDFDCLGITEGNAVDEEYLVLRKLCKKQRDTLILKLHSDKGGDPEQCDKVLRAFKELEEFFNSKNNSNQFKKNAPTVGVHFKLHTAVSNNDTATISRLLKKKPSLATMQDENGDTALHLAIHETNEDAVYMLLNPINIVIDKKNHKGHTPLHSAVNKGNACIVRLLLTKLDVNILDQHGNTPLHVAVSEGHTEIVEILLNEHASIDKKNHKGDTPILIAVQVGNPQIFCILLDAEQGKDFINKKNRDVYALLYTAMSQWNTSGKDIAEKYIEIAQALLDREKSIINFQDSYSRTLLHHAVRLRSPRIEQVQFLLENKIDLTIPDQYGYSALQYACHANKIETIKLLISIQLPPEADECTKWQKVSEVLIQLYKKEVDKYSKYYQSTQQVINNKHNELSTSLSNTKQDLINTQRVLQEEKEKYRRLSIEYANAEQKLNNLERQKSKLQREKVELNNTLSSLSESYAAQEKARDNMKRDNERFIAQKATLDQELFNLNIQKNDLERQKSELQREQVKLNNTLSSLSESYAAQEKACDNMKGDNERLIAQSSKLNQELSNLQNKKNDLEHQKSKLQRDNECLIAQRFTLNQELSNLNIQKNDLERHKSKLQRANVDLNNILSNLSESCKTQEKEFNDLKTDNAHLIAQRFTLNQELFNLNIQKNALERQKSALQRNRNSIQDTQQELSNAKMLLLKMEHQNAVKHVAVAVVATVTPLALVYFTMLPVLIVAGITALSVLATGLLVNQISSKLSGVSYSSAMFPGQQHLGSV